MATHKSAKKRIRTIERKRIINQRGTSQIKTTVKKVLSTTNKDSRKTLQGSCKRA